MLLRVVGLLVSVLLLLELLQLLELLDLCLRVSRNSSDCAPRGREVHP